MGIGPASTGFLWVCFSKREDIALYTPEPGTADGVVDGAQRDRERGGGEGKPGAWEFVPTVGNPAGGKLASASGEERMDSSTGQTPAQGDTQAWAAPPTIDFAACPSRAMPKPTAPPVRFPLVSFPFPAPAICSLADYQAVSLAPRLQSPSYSHQEEAS